MYAIAPTSVNPKNVSRVSSLNSSLSGFLAKIIIVRQDLIISLSLSIIVTKGIIDHFSWQHACSIVFKRVLLLR